MNEFSSGLSVHSIGVFIHLYYEELSGEFAQHLAYLPDYTTIYVSTDTEAKAETIRAEFSKYISEDRLSIKLTPNSGWDIAPFFVGFANEIQKHPIGLKIHGKRSSNRQDHIIGRPWRRHLLSQLLGSSERVEEVLAGFATYPDLGIVSAVHWPPIAPSVDIGANYSSLKGILARLGIGLHRYQEIDFPSGSMFWFRREAIEPLLALHLRYEDFEDPSNRTRDGTLAHALERSIYFSCRKAGLCWMTLPPCSPDPWAPIPKWERLFLYLQRHAKICWRSLMSCIKKSSW